MTLKAVDRRQPTAAAIDERPSAVAEPAAGNRSRAIAGRRPQRCADGPGGARRAC